MILNHIIFVEVLAELYEKYPHNYRYYSKFMDQMFIPTGNN